MFVVDGFIIAYGIFTQKATEFRRVYTSPSIGIKKSSGGIGIRPIIPVFYPACYFNGQLRDRLINKCCIEQGHIRFYLAELLMNKIQWVDQISGYKRILIGQNPV